MKTEISLSNSKGYKNEESLRRSLQRYGLLDCGCRFIICRKMNGDFTAVFLITSWVAANPANGGYLGFAAEHGFMSI